jgi:hypothetical protein
MKVAKLLGYWVAQLPDISFEEQSFTAATLKLCDSATRLRNSATQQPSNP